jgi:hypothetical protein
MNHYLLTAVGLAVMLAALPASAQTVPPPEAGHQLYIRDRAGKLIERLQPDGHQYEVFDIGRFSLPIGHARMLGRRMVIYDRQNHIVATVRAELPPPDSDLSVITIVRNTAGHPIGLLERY